MPSGSLDALGPDRAAFGDMADAFKMEALLLLPRAVALAVRPLTDVGLEPVVFKGPAVAARYPEPGLRPMDDIDLLLPRADHRRALEALGRAGWQVARAGDGDHYDTVLTHREVPSFFLEVHYGLEGASERVTALDPEALWARRQPLDCAGTAAFGLPPAEELVVLAAHAGKPHHRFVRLVWMADLAMIVGHAEMHGTAIDWDRVLDVARAARCVTVVGAALAMARRAGVDAPAGLFPLPTRGQRGDAMRRLLSVTWPLTPARTDRLRAQLRADRRAGPDAPRCSAPPRSRARAARPGAAGRRAPAPDAPPAGVIGALDRPGSVAGRGACLLRSGGRGPGRLGFTAGPVLHGPTAGDKRSANLGVPLHVETGEGERVRGGGGRRRCARLPSPPGPVRGEAVGGAADRDAIAEGARQRGARSRPRREDLGHRPGHRAERRSRRKSVP